MSGSMAPAAGSWPPARRPDWLNSVGPIVSAGWNPRDLSDRICPALVCPRPAGKGEGYTMKVLASLLVALALSAPQAIFGQAVYGSISGNLTDPAGAAVPQAKITITDVGKGVTYNTASNESGNYSQTH